jgi:hypothetical protein
MLVYCTQGTQPTLLRGQFPSLLVMVLDDIDYKLWIDLGAQEMFE